MNPIPFIPQYHDKNSIIVFLGNEEGCWKTINRTFYNTSFYT